jgi:hypothetical protein
VTAEWEPVDELAESLADLVWSFVLLLFAVACMAVAVGVVWAVA